MILQFSRTLFPRAARRKGFVLPTVLAIAMVLFIVAGAGFLIVNTNLSTMTFFEQQSVLEQATVSFGESLAKQVLLSGDAAAWNGPDPVRGTLSVDFAQGVNGIPPMRMNYTVTPSGPRRWMAFVTGEYSALGANGRKVNAMTWGVSIDIAPARPEPIIVEVPKRLH